MNESHTIALRPARVLGQKNKKIKHDLIGMRCCGHLENILIGDDGNKSIQFINRFESIGHRNEVKIN